MSFFFGIILFVSKEAIPQQSTQDYLGVLDFVHGSGAEMASRYLFQRLFSQMSRSTKLVGFASAPLPRPSSVARYFNTLPCSRAAAKTSSPTGTPSVVFKRMKPAFVDSIRGAKRAFASGSSTTMDNISSRRQTAAKISRIFSDETGWEAEMAAWEAQIDADCPAFQTERRAKEAAGGLSEVS
ncbi:hypothetical protein ACP70R_001394 [Stipagrostis hirtigluma subsp. patula]